MDCKGFRLISQIDCSPVQWPWALHSLINLFIWKSYSQSSLPQPDALKIIKMTAPIIPGHQADTYLEATRLQKTVLKDVGSACLELTCSFLS